MSNSPKMYEFSPAQEMIYFMLKYSIFHKQVIQIPASIVLKRKIDFDIMQKALEKEVERNDCMRLRFVKKGFKHIGLWGISKLYKWNMPMVYIRTYRFLIDKLKIDIKW